MAEVENKEATGTRRLVLGFDAGCMTCSDLARRIEEKVGDKLEVRGLRDPQVEQWRRKALGEDSPWAPTLIEIKGTRVRAWTGPKMAIYLSRYLGPVATWKVMQTLGDVSAVTADIAELPAARMIATSLTRGQFLKGVGGAAVAMSALSGTSALLFSSAADAQSGGSGSLSDRLKAKRIAEDSAQYKKLEEELEQAVDNPAASLNIDTDNVKVGGNDAAVGAYASYGKYGKRGVVALFYVNLKQEELVSYADFVMIPKGRSRSKDKSQYSWTLRVDDEKRLQVTMAKDYVITSDGRKMSYEKYIKELQSGGQKSNSSAQVRASDINDCTFDCADRIEDREVRDCNIDSAIANGITGYFAPLKLAGAALSLFDIGLEFANFCDSAGRRNAEIICNDFCTGQNPVTP